MFALCLLVYCNALFCPFIWDDDVLIIDNKHKDISEAKAFFGSEFFNTDISRDYRGQEGYYRPFVLISVSLDYLFYGLSPWGYHLTNVIIHSFNCILIFVILLLLSRRLNISLFVSLLFAVHPINADVVSYISGRTDSLCLLFMLLSLLSYMGYSRLKGHYAGILLFVVSLVLFFASLCSKESGVVLPLIIIAYEFCFQKKKESRLSVFLPELFAKLIPFVIVFLVYAYLRASALNSKIGYFTVWTDMLFWRMYSMMPVLLHWFLLIIFPYHLYFEDFTQPIAYWMSFKHIASTAFVLLVSAALLIRGRKDKFMLFAVLWIAITLIPVIHIIPVSQYNMLFTSQHSMYIPLIGVLSAIGVFVSEFYRASSKKRVYTVVFIVILAVLSARTFIRTEDWRDPVRFYEKEKKIAPFSRRVINNLGNVYFNRGKYDKAYEQFKLLDDLSSGESIKARWMLGQIFEENGQTGKAEQIFQDILKSDSKYAKAYNSLGLLYDNKGDKDKALEYYRLSIEADPSYHLPYFNMGRVFHERGIYSEALKYYYLCLAENPYYIQAAVNSGNIYLSAGDYKNAVSMLKYAGNIDSSDPYLLVNMAIYYARTKDYDRALRALKKAKEICSKSKPELVPQIENIEREMPVHQSGR
ncbi:MAG: tetratricopeptide repeat protein [Candidatus Aureabacteria bacterium]|nr:tetratricopeptide repeat protein [Candidatus Auribacterota bacterium]